MKQYDAFARGEVCARIEAASQAAFDALNGCIHQQGDARPPNEVLDYLLASMNVYRELTGSTPYEIVELGEGRGLDLELVQPPEDVEPTVARQRYRDYREGGYISGRDELGGGDDGEEG